MQYEKDSFSIKGMSNLAWLRIFGKSKCCGAKMEEVISKRGPIKWKCANCRRLCESEK